MLRFALTAASTHAHHILQDTIGMNLIITAHHLRNVEQSTSPPSQTTSSSPCPCDSESRCLKCVSNIRQMRIATAMHRQQEHRAHVCHTLSSSIRSSLVLTTPRSTNRCNLECKSETAIRIVFYSIACSQKPKRVDK